MTVHQEESTRSAFVSTGVAELDTVLGGGIAPHRLYVIEGMPGSGKTTLALQILQAGATAGEPVLYITLSETEEEIRSIARSHGWDLAGVRITEVVPDERSLLPAQQYTVFQPDEVELGETTSAILDQVREIKPSRVVLDSLSEIRLLAGSALRYRRQMLALKQFFAGRQCTVFVLDDRSVSADDPQLQSIAHGIVTLEQWVPPYGSERRRLRVVKYRGNRFIGGYHDFRIGPGGLAVFPRLVGAQQHPTVEDKALSSGIDGLDEMLGGGLERGTSALIMGAPGTGKSTVAALFALAAVQRGERAAIFLFDESLPVFTRRMRGLGQDVRPYVESGRLHVQQIDPAEQSPGEFAHLVASMATTRELGVAVIDSLNGCINAMPGENFLNPLLHEMLGYLGQMGTTTLMVGVQQGLIGAHMTSPVDASYLADSVLLLRYFESKGAVRQAVSVLKKRSGSHERTIREFTIGPRGVHVGAPLHDFHGVLTGIPEFTGDSGPLAGVRH